MPLSRRQILVSTIALAALAGVAMSPHLLAGRVAQGASELAGADRGCLPASAAACPWAFGFLSGRVRRHPRIAQVLEGFASLERSPRAIVTVLAWTCGMVACRLAATVAVAAALGLPHPFLAALVILPALDVASAFPITPGSIGVGSGAVAVALAGRGIAMPQALGTGFAMQTMETLVSIGAGTFGAFWLAREHPAVRRWTI